MIKIQIKSVFGKLLFDYEKENNTIKNTLHEAYLHGANLRGAYLQGADLHGANLQGANLQGANLQGADLRGAYLQGANLQGAYLHGANLRGAYLQGANLRGAYLQGADLHGANLHEADSIPMFCKWSSGIGGELIKIGCKQMTVKEWDRFFSSNEEFETKRGTEEFFRIEAMYLSLKAYKLKMDEFK